MNHFVHCCSFSTSNKITSKGCQSASKTFDFDAKNAKCFWGGGTAPSPDPSPSGEGVSPPHNPRPRRLRRLDLNPPPILKFCLRYWSEEYKISLIKWLKIPVQILGSLLVCQRPVLVHVVQSQVQVTFTTYLPHICTCDNKSVVCTLTFNQLLHLVSHPIRSWRLWPTSERETPGWADWGQQRERLPLGTPGLARLVWPAVVFSLKVTWI